MAAEREISHLPAHLLFNKRVINPLPPHLFANAHVYFRTTEVWEGTSIKWKYESGAIADSYWYCKERWWEALFDELVAYKQANDHPNVPQDGNALAKWVCEQ